MPALIARTEFAAAVNQLANERGVDPEIVIETIKSAILAAYKKDAKEAGLELDEEWNYQVDLDPGTGAAKIQCWSDDEEKKEDVTPPGFGRIAAQTAKQVILQKIREAEKSATINFYIDKIGTLATGMILRFDGPNIVVDLGKAEAVLPPHEQVQTDSYRLNQRLTFYIEGIRESMRGQEIVVSRAHKGLVELLFAREVPEVASGAVELKSIAREPGHRTKVAVHSTQVGVDPVGSCVGQKGVRVQAVIDELGGEKLDIIQYDTNPVKFITQAIAPSEVTSVTVDQNRMSALLVVPDDKLSLAIGKDGQNVRLAAKLTGYKLDIIGTSGAKPTSSHTTSVSADDQQLVPADDKTKTAKKETKAAKSAGDPPAGELTAAGLSKRTVATLNKAGITTLDDLKARKDDLKEIKGLGEKAKEEIEKILNSSS